MSHRDTDDRILEEAKAEVRRKLAAEEANWLTTRMGLAAVEYPNIMRSWLDFLLADRFKVIAESCQRQIDQLRAESKALRQEMNEKLDAARKAFADLKAANGRQPGKR